MSSCGGSSIARPRDITLDCLGSTPRTCERSWVPIITRCAEVIGKSGGFVAKYVGDGVLAYFGYPQAHEDDAERAVSARYNKST